MGHCANFALHNKPQEASPGNVYIVFLSRPHICFELWQQFDHFHVKSFLPLLWKELFINICRQQSKQEFVNTAANFTEVLPVNAYAPVPTLHPHLYPHPQHILVPYILQRGKQEGNGAQIPILLPIWEEAGAKQEVQHKSEYDRPKRDREESTKRDLMWKDRWRRALLGIISKTPVSYPWPFWSAFIVKVFPLDIAWLRILEWTVRSVPLILIAYFRALENVGEMLIIQSQLCCQLQKVFMYINLLENTIYYLFSVLICRVRISTRVLRSY